MRINKDYRTIENFTDKNTENPPKEMKLKAVKEDGYAIQYINNPSEEIQLAAVKENGWAIKFINNPSKEVQLEAVKEDGRAIKFINNPSKEVAIQSFINGYDNLIYLNKYIYEDNNKKDLSCYPDKIILNLMKNNYAFYKEFYVTKRYKRLLMEVYI